MRIKRNIENEIAPIQIGSGGNISIGMKHPEKGYPMALDYFRLTSKNKEYEKMFIEQLGEKPSSLKIIFVSENEESNCNQYLELRDVQGKRCAYSDGYDYYVLHNGMYIKRGNVEILEKYESVEAWELHLIKNVFRIAPDKAGKETTFREKLQMNFALVDLKGIGATWRFTTYATKSSIGQIVNAYDTTKNSLGRISFVPFDFIVKKVKSDKAGDSRSYPVVTLIPNISQNSMAILGDYFSAGQTLNGLITEQRVMELQSAKTIKLLQL